MIDRWNRFWFEMIDPTPWLVLRTAFAAVTCWWAINLRPDLLGLFGDEGIQQQLPDSPTRLINTFHLGQGDAIAITTWLALVISSALLAISRSPRVSSCVLLVTLTTLVKSGPLFATGAEAMLCLWAAFVVVFEFAQGPTSPTWSARTAIPYWGLRLFQIQLTAGYVLAVVFKLRGPTWRDGTAVYDVLTKNAMLWQPTPDWIIENSSLIAAATWGTIAAEAALPVLLWLHRTRRFAVAGALALHLAFDQFLVLGAFSLVMSVAALSFLDRWLLGLDQINAASRVADATQKPTSAESPQPPTRRSAGRAPGQALG